MIFYGFLRFPGSRGGGGGFSGISRRWRGFVADFEGGNFYLCSLLVAHAYSNAHMGGRPPLGLNRGALLPLSERPLLRMSGKPLLQVSGRPLLHMSGKPLLQVARDLFCDNFHRPFVHNTPRQIHSVHAPTATKTFRGRFNAFAPPLQKKRRGVISNTQDKTTQ